MNVAVVAHRKKKLDGGLGELRRVLADRGYRDPLWYDAAKSRETSKLARRAVDEGADLLFIWGGDGTVQRCVDAVARADVTLAILPAGTANLLATNLEIPKSPSRRWTWGGRGRSTAGRRRPQRSTVHRDGGRGL